MRRIGAALFVVIVSAAGARAQGGPVEVMVVSRTQPANAGAGATTAATMMEEAVRRELARLFPCASVTTGSDMKTYLGFQKQRQLLSDDTDGGIDALAGALGSNYVFSFSVTEMEGGNLSMKGSLINAATSKLMTTKTGTATEDKAVRGGEAAWLARQLVQGLSGVSRFSKDKCVPTNQWTGTIIYHAAEHNETLEESDGGSTKVTINSASSYDALIRIGWTGEPKAHVTATRSVRSDVLSKGRADCAKPGGFMDQTHNYKSTSSTDQTVSESLAEETVNASVSVTLSGRKIQLHVGTPTIQGKTTVTESKHFEGGCGAPTSSTDKAEGDFNVWGIDLTVEQPAGGMEYEQAGTYTGKDGVTLRWKLSRTTMKP